MNEIRDIYSKIKKNGNDLFLFSSFVSAIESVVIFDNDSIDANEIDRMYLDICS